MAAGQQYKVVPFIGTINDTQDATHVAGQLESVINTHASQGWVFDQIQDVSIRVKPGCLAALFGAKESYTRFDQIVFRKSV